MPISVAEIIRRKRTERAIEELLFAYPYLIHPSLANPLRQVYLSTRSRADLLFIFQTKLVFVEIKRGTVDTAAVTQALRYYQDLKTRNVKIEAFIIGESLPEQAQKKLKSLPFLATFRALGTDIPRRIVVCAVCRKARSADLHLCPYDGSSQVLSI